MSAYRDQVEALVARHEALTAELTEKAREVATSARLLDEARARVRLPVLDHIHIATPCKAGWENMVGDDKVRFCGTCQKNVYNLSELTREEAEALILEKEGNLCGRYYQRQDGTILTKDCAVGISQRRKRRLLAAGAAGLLASAGTFLAVRQEAARSAHCDAALRLTEYDDPESRDVGDEEEETVRHIDGMVEFRSPEARETYLRGLARKPAPGAPSASPAPPPAKAAREDSR
jgi:hypothetical protein